MHDSTQKVTEKWENAHSFHNESNERVFEQNQGDAAKEKYRGSDFRGSGEEVYGSGRANDENDANHEKKVSNGQKTGVKEGQDSEDEEHHASGGQHNTVFCG